MLMKPSILGAIINTKNNVFDEFLRRSPYKPKSPFFKTPPWYKLPVGILKRRFAAKLRGYHSKGESLGCCAFRYADALYQAMPADRKKDWKDAVKRPRTSAYDLWMKECLWLVRQRLTPPDYPSISGGFTPTKALPGVEHLLAPCWDLQMPEYASVTYLSTDLIPGPKEMHHRVDFHANPHSLDIYPDFSFVEICFYSAGLDNQGYTYGDWKPTEFPVNVDTWRIPQPVKFALIYKLSSVRVPPDPIHPENPQWFWWIIPTRDGDGWHCRFPDALPWERWETKKLILRAPSHPYWPFPLRGLGLWPPLLDL